MTEFTAGGIEGFGNLTVDANNVGAIYYAAQSGTPIDVGGVMYRIKQVKITARVHPDSQLLQVSEAPHLIFEKVGG